MIYSMSDLHLSEAKHKPMDIFHPIWKDHSEKITSLWPLLDNDTIIIPGDISWANNIEELSKDLLLIDSLPGRKILIRGNHDIWWAGESKVRDILAPYPSISFIHNSSVSIDGISICGCKGADVTYPEKFVQGLKERELSRLRQSLEAATCIQKIVFTHYPMCGDTDFIQLLEEFSVSEYYFGHAHGDKIKDIPFGRLTNTLYSNTVAADQLAFCPRIISI